MGHRGHIRRPRSNPPQRFFKLEIWAAAVSVVLSTVAPAACWFASGGSAPDHQDGGSAIPTPIDPFKSRAGPRPGRQRWVLMVAAVWDGAPGVGLLQEQRVDGRRDGIRRGCARLALLEGSSHY